MSYEKDDIKTLLVDKRIWDMTEEEALKYEAILKDKVGKTRRYQIIQEDTLVLLHKILKLLEKVDSKVISVP